MKNALKIFVYFTAGCLILVIIMSLLLLFTPLGPMVVIGFEDVFTKWDIDNPYVNNNFSNCEEVYIGTDISFHIPKDWTMEYKNGVYSLIDSGGNVWAIGSWFGTESDYFDDYSDFFAANICSEPFELSIDACTEYVAMECADIDKITINYSDRSESYYNVNLYHLPTGSFLLVFFSDISQSTEDFDIVEAIMYSFAYEQE